MPHDTLAALLKRLRRTARLSQERLAERAGLSPRTIGDIECGVQKRPRPGTVRALADGLGAGADERLQLERAAFQVGAVLPSELDLVGREQDVDAVVGIIRARNTNLATITGAPGVGKTALAIRVAHVLADDFLGGVAFITLDEVMDSSAVLRAIARDVGAREAEAGALEESIVERIGVAPTLVVVDNVEHVLDAASAIVQVVRRLPSAFFLLTGRSALNASGEYEYSLQPLSEADARALFLRRAASSVPRLDEAKLDLATIDSICERLDHLPLAIELAAPRLRMLAPSELLERLTASNDLLGSGPPDTPARHQALTRAIEWSYRLLAPNEQVAFRRLGVFPADADMRAVEAIAGCTPDQIEAISRHSLISTKPGLRRARVTMLRTIRAFASRLLDESGERDTIAERHARHYARLGSSFGNGLFSAQDQLEIVRGEIANFRAALTFLASREDWSLAATMLVPFANSWGMQGGTAEAAAWGDRILGAIDSNLTPDERVELLLTTVRLHAQLGNIVSARALADEAIALADDGQNVELRARARARRAYVHWRSTEYEEARLDFEAGLALLGPHGDAKLLASLYHDLGAILLEQEKPAEAMTYLQRALEVTAEKGAENFLFALYANISLAQMMLGCNEVAEEFARRSTDIATELRSPVMLGKSLLHSACVAEARGDAEAARATYADALGLSLSVQSLRVTAECYEDLARLFSENDRSEIAAMLVGLARSFRKRCGLAAGPDQIRKVDAAVSTASAALGEARFNQSLLLGAAMEADDVLKILRETRFSQVSTTNA